MVINVKTRSGHRQDVQVPIEFLMYSFNKAINVKACCSSPEGVAVLLTRADLPNYQIKQKKPVRRFVAISTFYNWYRISIPESRIYAF